MPDYITLIRLLLVIVLFVSIYLLVRKGGHGLVGLFRRGRHGAAWWDLRNRQQDRLIVLPDESSWHPVDPFQMDQWLGLTPETPEQSNTASPDKTVPGATTTEPTEATGKWTLTSGGRMAGWRTPRILTTPPKQSKMPSRTEAGLPVGGSPGPALESWGFDSDQWE